MPHSHICFFLHKDDKIPNVEQIDRYVAAEIPDKNEDPELYKLVGDFMMHGPCGADDPDQACMVDMNVQKSFQRDLLNIAQSTRMGIRFIGGETMETL